MVLQCTVLIVHCRPDSTGITPSIERVTLESQQTASVAAIIKSLENGTPLSLETRKHLAANVAFTEPLQSLQRHLPHGSPDINKNVEPTTPTKNRFDGEKLATPTTTTTTTTTVTATSTTTKKPVTTAKPIRYLHRLYMNRNAKHISNANETTQHTHLVDGQSQIHVKHNNNNSLTNVDASTQFRSFANQTNRQYLGNVYGINTYITKPLLATSTTNQSIPWQLTAMVSTTQRPYIETIFRPTTESTTFYLTPNGVFHQTMSDSSPSPIIVSNTLFKPIDTETYQLHQPPSHVPQYDGDDESSTLNGLQHTQNITKLYSIIGTSTVHSYGNVEETPNTPATVTKNKILKRRVTTVGPSEPAHDDDSSESQLTDLNIPYTERYTTHVEDNSMHAEHNENHGKTNATNILTNKTKECSIDGSDSDSICKKTNDLKIIIKLDNGKKRIAHNGNVRGKVKLRRVTTTTTTTTPTSYADYESYNYEQVDDNVDDDDNGEEDDGDYGFGGYVEPIQNVLGFVPAYQTRKKKPTHEKPNKHDKDDIVNKYQTIILQTHAPPVRTTEAPHSPTKHTKEFSLHALLYKLLAFMPFLAIKPIFFGFWTMVLSPFIVIAVSGIALAVTLYPWIMISHEQVAYARLSSRRAPKIIVHRHPIGKIYGRPKMVRQRPHRTMTINRNVRQPPFLRRRRRHARTLMQPFNEMREAFDNGSMLNSQRFPSTFRTNIMRRHLKRRDRDIHFQEWLLVQNNFNVRILSHNDHDNY